VFNPRLLSNAHAMIGVPLRSARHGHKSSTAFYTTGSRLDADSAERTHLFFQKTIKGGADFSSRTPPFLPLNASTFTNVYATNVYARLLAFKSVYFDGLARQVASGRLSKPRGDPRISPRARSRPACREARAPPRPARR
jgi:hypothetical protein